VRGASLPQVFLLLAIAFLPAIGQALYLRDRIPWESPVPASMRATVQQAKSWGADVLWVDARSDKEYAREHFPNAISLNEDRFNEQLPAVLVAWSPGKRVVVYCSTQECGASRAIAQRLQREANLDDVFVLEGGWEMLRAGQK
jgi:rhodanese-related sulfurtransferase